jgi:hypothetical protein
MTVTDRYRTIADLPTDFPVFPLTECILLPRATLPLNVFEPRYLQMVNDVLAGARVLGIIQPAATAGGRESPSGKAVPLRTIGCLGRLSAFEELADGRVGIVLTGVARFAVVEEIETATPYRRVRADFSRFAADLERGSDEGEIDREALIEALRSYLQAKGLRADWGTIEKAASETLVNGLSLASPYGAEEKQALLEAPTLAKRAEALITLARIELAGDPSGGDTPRRLQ